MPKRGEVIVHPGGHRIRSARCRSAPDQAAARAQPAGSDRRRRRGRCLRHRCSGSSPARGSRPRSAAWPIDLAALSGWRRYGLAFLLGVCATATLPPVDLTPLLLVAFPGLLWLDEGSAGPWASFRLGYAFGFGFFLSGLYWIAAALFVDIASFWWLVPVAAAGLPAAFALYAGLALLATQSRRSSTCGLPAAARVFAFAVAWTRRRMGPRPRLHRAAVEFDRLCLVGRVSRARS